MDKATVIRTLILLIALTNQFLVTLGLNPVPGNETIWFEVLSTIFTFGAAAIAWFKNNYVTARGKSQKEVLKRNSLIK
ncbi:phage holin [Oceanobacillus iheyensis]|uniref:phage holin n=1 Tax=Oceanobacillus iheyensis TaxID=182710 RepID=UPI0036326ABB